MSLTYLRCALEDRPCQPAVPPAETEERPLPRLADHTRCTGCTACTKACPRGLLKMKPVAPQPAVLCRNKERGAAVVKACKTGCIGCGICVKNSPQQAIFLRNNVARIDYTKCNGCGTCVAKCPKKAIQWVEGAPRPVDAPVPEHEVR